MKFRRCAGLLLSVSLLVVGAPTALAHGFPSPTPIPGVAPLSDQEQYKLAMEHFRIDTIEFKKIANRFTAAADKAKFVFDAAMATAKSDKVKSIIQARFDSSILNAINIREAAIKEMGGAPVEPTKPVESIGAAVTKKAKTNKPSPTPSP